MRTLIIPLFFFTLLALSSAHGEGLKESWYMYRGRDNMKIKNYKAAIEAYEKVVEMNPDNREASKDLGFAYENQGVVDKAVGQYDQYLNRWPQDHEVALRQARLLKWSRYSYRRQDSLKYYKAALNSKNDPQVRLEYAELLAAKKETNDQAIREYETVLRSQPKNAQAHRGIAKAFAWQGDSDRALHHTQLAQQYGDKTSETRGLERQMEQDRRPELGVEGFAFNQVGDRFYDLNGFRLGGRGQYGLTPFSTISARAGFEIFGNPDKSKSGGYFGIDFEHRLSPGQSLHVGFDYHSMSLDHLEYRTFYQWVDQSQSLWKVGFKNEMLYDSYLSLIGDTVNGQELGAAHRNRVFLDYKTKFDLLEVQASPYVGWVTSKSAPSNNHYGADFTALYPLTNDASSQWAGVSLTQVNSFQRDQSGLSVTSGAPEPGGYFSPSFFWNQELLARYQNVISDSDSWMFQFGPSYQQVQGTASDGSKMGGRLGWQYQKKAGPDSYMRFQLDGIRMGDLYTQLIGQAFYIKKF